MPSQDEGKRFVRCERTTGQIAVFEATGAVECHHFEDRGRCRLGGPCILARVTEPRREGAGGGKIYG